MRRIPRTIGPSQGVQKPRQVRHQQPGVHRRRRQLDRREHVQTRVVVAAGRAASRGRDHARGEGEVRALEHRRPRGLDRQRLLRHGHDHRRRLGPTSHHRGRRCHCHHCCQSSAMLRHGGHGTTLWLFGARCWFGQWCWLDHDSWESARAWLVI